MHILAATAAAEPPDEPPGTRVMSCGFLVVPKAEFSVDDPCANSSKLVLPKSTAPCSRNFLITVASVGYDTVKKDITLTGVDTIRIDFNLHIKYNFEPGIVLMGIVDSASFRSVFNFDDTIGFPLPQMTGFEHTTNLISLDSANQIYNLLFEKPYLNKYGSQPKVIEIGDSARVTVYNFFDMSREKFLDWFSVRDSLGIFYVNNPNKYIQIKVPTGDEKYWLNQFKKSNQNTY